MAQHDAEATEPAQEPSVEQERRSTGALLSPLNYYGAANRILYLVRRRQRWIHRRVDTIEYVDDRRIYRHVSVDFTVPAQAILSDYPDEAILPIGLLKKGPLVRFSIYN